MTLDSTLAVAAQRRSTKRVFLATTSAAAVLVASALVGLHPAYAQTAQGQTAQSQTAQSPAVEEITVTGSLIVRNGYQAPTPVTVMSAKDIEDIGAINFIDAAVKMPALGSGTNSHTSGDSNSDGQAGTNSLSLRELGAYRTLVLLDGVRVTPDNPIGNVSDGGSVDINSLPDGLIQRMDVVTGGATATYGSGALAGVVNLVLDKDFTGLKGTIEGGVTTYGDDRQYAITLTGGTGFAGGRGHFLIDLEDRYTDGVPDAQQARPWIANDWGQITNPAYTPTNGQPFYLLVPQAGAANYAPGGVITSGPLKGIAFSPTGSPTPFIYGSPTDGTVMSGGNYQAASGALNGNFGTDGSLDVHLVRQNVFTRLSYDVSDDVNLYAQWGYSTSDVDANGRYNYASVSIASGNPFLPAAIQQQMTADGLKSISLGLYLTPLGQLGSYANRIFNMYLAGGEGKFDAFGSNWSWNVFATQSSSITSDTAHNVYQKTNLTNVVNAVTGPNGVPICASSVTNPGNGCVPFDPFGTNVASQAAINGLIGIYDHEHLDEWLDEIAGTVKGEPFSTWAGPVSLALGLEWDKNASKSVADPIALQGGYSTGNFGQVIGRYETKEGFGEVVVPLAKDQAWAKSLDLNAGIRETNFSNTGDVLTWKVGGTYSPIDDIRFRVTQSRDTRSPNLGELFSTGKAINGTVNNPWQANGNVVILEDTVGNPQVHPETADTTGIGVVVQPSWLHNFSASFDYYHIKISNSLTSLGVQQAITDCYQYGTFCNLVVQDASHNISEVYIQPVNALGGAGQKGFDLEASYTQQLADIVQSWEGSLNVRLLTTHLLDQYSTASDGTYTPGNFPSWRYTLTVDYDADRFSVNWTGRGVNGYKINSNWITCTSSCPTSVPPYYTVNDNWIPHQFYMDMAFTYHLKTEGASNVDLFFNVEDLANAHPPAISFLGNTLDFGNPLGRIFRAGVRFKM